MRQFTGKERDSETGLDYFGARYFSGAQGRFTSPDIPLYAQDPAEPQSWNLYSYTANNPLARIDPDGRNWFNINGTWQWHEGSDVNNDGDPCKKGTRGCNHSDYTHLLVVTRTGTDRRTGAGQFRLTLYNQDRKAAEVDGYSGSSRRGQDPIQDGEYRINLGIRNPAPTTFRSDGNPPADWGVQDVPDRGYSGPSGLPNNAPYLIYGPIRARLNPVSVPGLDRDRGLYLHGDPQNAQCTWGCLSYGNSQSIVRFLQTSRQGAAGVVVNQRVRRP